MQPKITLSEILALPPNGFAGVALVDDVLRVLHNNAVLTPKDVAMILDAPKRDLSAAIRLLTGVSLDEFIKEYRKHQATRLLSDTDIAYDVVAHICGFSSLHNLSLFLIRETGLTAYEWRMQFFNGHRDPAKRSEIRKKLIELSNEKYSGKKQDS